MREYNLVQLDLIQGDCWALAHVCSLLSPYSLPCEQDYTKTTESVFQVGGRIETGPRKKLLTFGVDSINFHFL